MKLSAFVWKLGAACANEDDDMKQTKTTGWYTLIWWVDIKDLKIYKSKIYDYIRFFGVNDGKWIN